MSVNPRLLILETSGRAGQVALAERERLVGARRLDETRRHARDLAPALRELLRAQDWTPKTIDAVIVGRGPGSYTGLRVGIMSAKAFAYATHCALVAIDTFAAIAQQAPPEVQVLDVLADAQQDRVYVQSFERGAGGWRPRSELAIRPFAPWLAALDPAAWLTGPGLRGQEHRLTGNNVLPAELWDPQPESLAQLGFARFQHGERDDLWLVEPLYLRPSAAEQQWRK